MNEGPIQKYISELSDQVISRDNTKDELKFPELETSVFSPIFRGERPVMPEQEQPMGWFEAAKEHAKNFHITYQASKFITDSVIPDDAAPDFSGETIPDNWNQYNEAALDGLSQNYWGYILEGQSPAEQAYRREKALDEMRREERLANAGWTPAIAGGAAAFFGDPVSYVLPQIAVTKWAMTAKALSTAAARTSLNILPQAAALEALIQANRLGGNVEDFALNTIRDTAFGVALWGVGQGAGAAFRGADIWTARKAVNASYNGVDIKVRINEKTGAYEGLEAVAANDLSAGAAQVETVQKFLDEGAVLRGLSGWIGPLNKIPGIGSPLVAGLSSTSATVRTFANRLANVSILTGSMLRGVPRAPTATELLRETVNEGRQLSFKLHDLYLESLGIKPGVIGSAKSVVKQLNEGVTASRSQFDADVANVVLTGVQHGSAAVNEGASLLENHLNKIWKQYLKVNDLPEDIMPPRTAAGYLMRQYNKPEMIKNQRRWIDTVSVALKEQDAEITRIMQPFNALRSENKALNKLLTTPGVTDAQARNARNTIARNTRRMKAFKKQLNKDIADGVVDSSLLDSRSWMTNAEREQLKTHIAPIEKLKQQIADAKEDLKQIPPNQRTPAADKIKAMKTQLLELQADFAAEAAAGRISRKLWVKNKEGHIHPRDPDEIPKFRKVYEDDLARQEAADVYYNRLMGTTPEQINQEVFNHISGGEVPDPAKGRTLLIPDKTLLDAGFLSTDLNKMIGVYSSVLGKRIALKQAFSDVDWHDGVKGIGDLLKQEHDARKMQIERTIPEGKKRDKALLKANKEFDGHKHYIQSAYDIFMGTYATSDLFYKWGKATRNWTAATSLNNVPLLQTGDLFGITFKQGIWPWITTGVSNLIDRTNILSRNNRSFRKNADHALVGLEIELSSYTNWLYESNSMEHVQGGGFFRYLDIVSKVTPAVNMTNFMTNFLQRFSANVTQSRVMTDLFIASRGKLSKSGQRRLLMNGIDPNDAARYIEQYNTSGGHKLHGGHVSNWYLWGDAKLQQNMKRAIMNDIQGGVVEAGILDKPFWTNKPIIGLPFQLMGYVYATNNRYLIPLLQTPDGNKIMGMIMMSAMASLYEPMRAWARGEEFKYKDDRAIEAWMINSVLASGSLGWMAEALQIVDALIQPDFLNDYRQGKYRRRKLAGILVGPAGGMGENMFDVAKMFVDGKVNQQDLMKLKKVVPVPGNLVLSKFVNDVIKNSDIPESARESDSWWEL